MMAKVIRTGRIGKIINRIQVGGGNIMLELAFNGQLWTECFFSSEVEEIKP